MAFTRSLASLLAALTFFAISALGQTAADEFHQSISGAFVYGIKIGQFYNQVRSKPGYSVGYAYRPLPWLEAEAGLTQIIHTIPPYIGRYPGNADDQYFLVPFGVRFVYQPGDRRTKLTIGGGGAYLQHVGNPDRTGYSPNATAWGTQAVASADYATSDSGRFRLGVIARYFYGRSDNEVITRTVTVGPQLTFSFH